MPGPLDLTIHLPPLHMKAVKEDLERVLHQIETLLGAGVGTTQPEWYVNSVIGNDDADGATPTTALKTLAALDARMGFSIIQQYTQVHLSGDFSAETMSIRTSSALSGSTAYPLAILGTPAVLRTGTLTATANQAVGDPAAPQVTDPTVTDWNTAGPGGSSLLLKRLRITAAPGAPGDIGKYCWLKQDEGAGVVTVSFPSQALDPSSGDLPTGISLSGLSSPPYDYVVEELTQVGAFVHSSLFLTRVNVSGIATTGSDVLIQASGGFLNRMLVFDGCDIGSIISTTGFPAFFGCRMDSPDIYGVGAFISGCLIDNGPITNSSRQMFLAGNTLAIGNNLYQGSELGASSSFCGLLVGGASAFNAPGAAVQLEIGSTMHAFGGILGGTLNGTGNATGIKVGSNSAFSYDLVKSNLPTITGGTEVQVGSTSTTWAAIDAAGGFIEITPPTLARVVRK